jgi:ABC-2 type transport system permease protein
MTAHRTFAIVLRQYYLMRGSFSRFIPLFLWVAIDMVLWGFLARYLDSLTASGMGFVPKLLGAVLLWDFLTRVMQGVTIAFLEDVWSRNFLNFFATPLSVSEYVGGLIITSVLTSSVGLAVMLTLAATLFGLSFFSYGLVAIPFIAILFLTGISLGVLGCALVLRLGPASEWFIWPIPILISPFAGVFYPISVLPAWMRAVSYALPPSYVFEGMRASLATGTVSAAPMAIGGALAIAYLGLAFLAFKRTYRYAIRTGLIARYSAESVA